MSAQKINGEYSQCIFRLWCRVRLLIADISFITIYSADRIAFSGGIFFFSKHETPENDPLVTTLIIIVIVCYGI